MNILRLFTFIALLTLPAGVSAASDVTKKAQNPKEKEGVQYSPITRASLSQLYWRMGAYDVKNDIDVDNFLLLNRCDLYKKSYRDDFAWHAIRVKAQESLKKNAEKFTDRLEFMQPIRLGRYNVQEQHFPLVNPIRTSRFEVEAEEEWPCEKVARTQNIWKYPHRAIVSYAAPLKIYSIDVTPEIAKAYNKLYQNIGIYDARPAYIVVKFKVYEAIPFYKGLLKKTAPAKISAMVEQVDFYADFNREYHLGSLDYRKLNKKKLSGEK